MTAVDEYKPQTAQNDEVIYMRPNMLGQTSVGTSSGSFRKHARISKAVPKKEAPINIKNLEMLEFPLPKRLWQDGKDTKRCSCCTNRFRRLLKGGKHHCRICGRCVCSICSVYKLRDYRICKKCKRSPEVQERFPELLENQALALRSKPIDRPITSIFDKVVLSDDEMLETPFDTPKKKSKINRAMTLPIYESNETKDQMEDFPMGGSLCESPAQYKYSGKDQGQTSDIQSVSPFDFSRNGDGRPTLIQPCVNLEQWKTVHCVRWIKGLRLKESEEKTVEAIRDLGLCGSDLQGLSDSDLQSELKIHSSILRRRILRSLERLTQDVVDEILKEEENSGTLTLSNKELSQLARDVQVLKMGSFSAVDRIVMLNSPENKWQVEWYTTNIRAGIHKVTVIDRNNITNSSYWVLKYKGKVLVTHCLSTNPNGLRWRLHNSSVEVCVNTTSDELNTDLLISLQSVTLPESGKANIKTIG